MIIIFLSSYLQFFLSKLIVQPWIRIQIEPKSWIWIQIQCIWIHNTWQSVIALYLLVRGQGWIRPRQLPPPLQHQPSPHPHPNTRRSICSTKHLQITVGRYPIIRYEVVVIFLSEAKHYRY